MKFKNLSFLFIITIFIQALFVCQVTAKTNDAKTYEPEVVFKTNKGSFTLKLYPLKAPKTVENFLRYVDEGFYNNTLFHRAISDFVIQGGGFEKGMKYKQPHAPVKNESANQLKNIRGSISMARRSHPDTATSQFYINLAENTKLDYINHQQPGYTVFGEISTGMDVIDAISMIQTHKVEKFTDVPTEDIVIISVTRKSIEYVHADKQQAVAPLHNMQRYIAGEHYVVLEQPVLTRDSNKIEVVEMFSYGCPHCYEFDSQFRAWSGKQSNEVDMWKFPAVWNESMKVYAKTFYTAKKLNVLDEIHTPLFNAVVIKQKKLSTENELAVFFENYGIDKKYFIQVFNSAEIARQAKQAQILVKDYKPAGVPEIIVNGKYRIDRMRAGGMQEMLAVADFLVQKERDLLKNE